ncbi:tripartite motif-containing protein 16-like protein [Chanos chanos]|uniref:Tripartite motif-containing protein 16-like protein n=1 Tax=Chanos chanos TaxID=29144 RepID=A0A6J2UZE6_CHACN|nr:tripartite motif-containing protein 16-like protein [Chanos chanos]
MKPGKPANNQAEKTPVYEPHIPEPTCRAELLKYWIDLSLDEKTANKMLWISEGGSKVCRRTEEVCPYLDRPERFELSPQVLCKESVWGARGYWEVEYSGWVVIGATYEGVGRKGSDGPCGLGENEESWALGWSGSSYHAWYNCISKEIRGVPHSPVLGLYVDQPAGLMIFYLVEGGKESRGEREVRLLHRIQADIQKPVIPGFWVGINSSCVLLKKE